MKNNYRILAINPGSTSTKMAVYENGKELLRTNIEHSANELAVFPRIGDQYDMRKSGILSYLQASNIPVSTIDAIASRGAPLPPIKGGAYLINEKMAERIRVRPYIEHASNLAVLIGFDLSKEWNIPAYIYDGISTDELSDISRISGMPSIPRKSLVHTLNMKAVCRKVALKWNRDYETITAIVAHLGGGITLSIHQNGKMIDVVSDDEGPFSPERAGRVPCNQLIIECYSGQYDLQTMKKMSRGRGGLVAHLNTNSALEVEKKIKEGDEKAKLIYEAMAYQVAKSIGELATVVEGKVDGIILTGGIAYSNTITDWITKRVRFIAPVEIIPGENELESLALGVERVLLGKEDAHTYDLE